MNRWQRVGAYVLQRLGEPTTWAGIVAVITGLGINVSPEKAQAIGAIGTTISGLLLMVAREGVNAPSNPTLPTAIKGEMPEPRPHIVPPAPTESTVAIDPKHVGVDAEGNLKAPDAK